MKFYSVITLLTVASVSGAAGADFDWSIKPRDNSPAIGFDDKNRDSEVVFTYDFTGKYTADLKYFKKTIFLADCKTEYTGNSLIAVESVQEPILTEIINVDQASIASDTSVYAAGVDTTTAYVNFCFRVDYMYSESGGAAQSIYFHETNVKVTIDTKSAEFLLGVNVVRTSATETTANTNADYPVNAYPCDESNVAVTKTYAQGDFLQMCVEYKGSTSNVYVADILTMTIAQVGSDPSTVIVNQAVDGLTYKDCLILGQGKCNVKTQLPSKFFATATPEALSITGIAIIGFGPNPSPDNRRLAMVPIRMLQSDAQGEFSLEARLVKAEPVAQQQSSSNSASTIGIVVGVIGAVGLAAILMVALFLRRKKRSKKEDVAEQEKAVIAAPECL